MYDKLGRIPKMIFFGCFKCRKHFPKGKNGKRMERVDWYQDAIGDNILIPNILSKVIFLFYFEYG